jgi:HTH-type transcriptional regulator / antitoxin HipB
MVDMSMSTEIKLTDDLGQLIMRRRKDLGMTQAELAGYCGVGRRFIVELENGKASIQMGKALHVLRHLGLRVKVAAE